MCSSMAPPDSHEEGGDGVKENIDPLHQDLQSSGETERMARFSFGVDTLELSCLAMKQ